jgi:hypothetical protein
MNMEWAADMKYQWRARGRRGGTGAYKSNDTTCRRNKCHLRVTFDGDEIDVEESGGSTLCEGVGCS